MKPCVTNLNDCFQIHFTCIYSVYNQCPLTLLFSRDTDLVTGNKAGVTNALQLCTLLLPQANRTHLHGMLRFLYKASTNSRLLLCQGKGNMEELVKHFTSVILRSCSKLSRVGMAERQRVEQLVTFMAQNYQHIFKVCTMYA